jgi:hypothetical protein
LGRDTTPKAGFIHEPRLLQVLEVSCWALLSRPCWSLWIIGQWLMLSIRHLGEGLSW